MEFNKVINGLVKYIDKEIIKDMNQWQELMARVSMSRIIGNSNSIKNALSNNPFIRTFAIIDDEGNVDVDGLAQDIKRIIRDKGFVEISLPMFGTFKFTENDIDVICSYIRSV